jgi:hypothetical protein
MLIRYASWALLVSLMATHATDASAQSVRRSRRAKPAEQSVVVAQPAPEAEPAAESVDPTVKPLEWIKGEGIRGGLLPNWFKDVKVDGAVEATYTYNDRRPANGRNEFRAFDRRHNAGMLNQVQIRMMKDATEESPVGFGLKVNAGEDADVFRSLTEEFTDKVEVQEAYGAVRVPVGRGITVKAGKLPGLAGAEVIETRDNFNISRGLVFSLLQPFTVTGVRVEAPVSDKVTLTGGLTRGWDVSYEDNNAGESVEAKVTYNPTDKTSIGAAVLTGPEQFGNNGNTRTLLDLVVTHKFSDSVDGFVNADYITEEGAGSNGGGGDASGVAVGLRKKITEKFSVAGRLEVVDDHDGARTGTRQSLGSGTVTGDYKFRENVIGRLEFRHDTSSDSTFVSDTRPVSNQNTIATALLVTF